MLTGNKCYTINIVCVIVVIVVIGDNECLECTKSIDLIHNGGQFIVLLSKCKLAYQASIPYSELKRILALK